LIDACYDREQFPTRAEAIDWTWASSTAEIEAVDFVLSKFFTLEDGRYVQKRIEEEVAAYHATSETNKRIAEEREAKRKEALAKRARGVDEPPPNQEPLTTNQEPKEKKDIGSAVAELPAKTITARMLMTEGIDKQAADDWLTLRKAKRLPLTPTAWDDTKAEGLKVGLTPAQTVAHAVRSNWAGFKASWYTKDGGQAAQPSLMAGVI
jgi:uncharacterized protein YdaU (DUF1376 family)